MQARSDIGIIHRIPAEDNLPRARKRALPSSCINGWPHSGRGTINQFALFEDADCCSGSVGDFLYSLGDEFSGGCKIQLQSLNEFLGFYNRGQIFREVGLESFRAQAIVVLLEHISGREQLLKRSLVKQRLTLRAGSCLGHKIVIPRQPVGESGKSIVMQSTIQIAAPKHTCGLGAFR